MKQVKVSPRTFQNLWDKPSRNRDQNKPAYQERPIFLQLTDVTEVDVERLEKAETKAEIKQVLSECLNVDQSEGFRKDILADLYYHNYGFCVSCKLSAVKTSCFLSIMKVVLEEAVAKRLLVEDAFQLFKDWLLKHGVERPPKSVGIFSFEEIKKIMEYAHNTFFRHYRLYMYVYMTHCNMAFRAEDLDVGIVVPYSRPLALPIASEVEAKDQPEFAHYFVPSEREQAEATLRNIRDRDKPEDRAVVIKRKVDEGVAQLMERFEDKLKEQDARFAAMLKE
jgi:hypothetical protein